MRLLFLVLLAGCGQQDFGYDAEMRVDGAQFERGAMPAAMNGPAVTSLLVTSGRLAAGLIGKPISGLVPLEVRAVALALDGDVGYWIVQPGRIDPQTLTQLGFSARLSFSPKLTAGNYRLIARAVDAAGHFGPISDADLTISASAADGAMFAMTLEWDTQADLDLHVVTPSGVEIWAKNINSAEPPAPGQTADPNAWQAGGILDFDSNANCVIDGRRRETVYWTQPPPSGRYLARVDTYSMCGEAQANWTVTATLGGQPAGRAFGFSRDNDAAMKHEAGAGVTALTVDVP